MLLPFHLHSGLFSRGNSLSLHEEETKKLFGLEKETRRKGIFTYAESMRRVLGPTLVVNYAETSSLRELERVWAMNEKLSLKMDKLKSDLGNYKSRYEIQVGLV